MKKSGKDDSVRVSPLFTSIHISKKVKGIKLDFSYSEGSFIKELRSRGEGFFRCGRPHFLVQKHRIFRNLWCVRTDNTGGGGHFSNIKLIEPVRTFTDKGEWVNFVRTSFIDGP